MAGYCPSCGKALSDDARFCPSCGKALASSSPPAGGYPPAVIPGLVRPRHGRVLAGVCRGIANRLGWNISMLRLIFVILGVLTVPFWIVVYLILWMIMPEEGVVRAPQSYSGGGAAGGSDQTPVRPVVGEPGA